jgi:uncharacterized protein YggE
MVSTRVFLGVVAVFAVITAGLLVGLNVQRDLIYLNPSSGAKIAISGGEGFGTLGGVFAQEQVTDNTLFVSGTATASDNPDEVTVMFSVDTEDLSARVSQQENAQITADVRAALITKGIDSGDIETTGYGLSKLQEYDSATRKYVDKGYRTYHSMQVKLSDIDKAGEIIDTVVQAGANRINGVYFGLSDSRLGELRMDALKAASENARDRADSIASGLGITVNRVMSVSEGYTYSPSSRLYAAEAAADIGAGAPSTEITPGDIYVSATVNVVFEIA